jgi:peptidoglycan/LPS O-acetylase OafA/YrhL
LGQDVRGQIRHQIVSKLNSQGYRPDVDGLRALAVLPVLLFHAKLGCPGGFVGVDIFFVISGFLISSLILKELDNGVFSLITFWERRIRRILPALAVVVLATLVAGWFLFLPTDFEALGKSVIAQAMLLSNFFFYQDGRLEGGYFSAISAPQPLLHTWSLAVEEQFYLLFPLLLVFLARYPKPSTIKIVAAIAIGSFVLSIFGSYYFPSATFYFLPTRAWELLTGSLLALMLGRLTRGRLVNETAGWLGIILISYALFFYHADTRFPGLAAIPPCLGAALIIFSSESELSLVGRVLTFKPVVFIGLISYSLYLWHWPLLVFSKYPFNHQGWKFRIAMLAASFMFAILSWKYVETPFRKRRVLQKRPQIFQFAGVSMATLLIFGFFVFQSEGIPARFSGKAYSYIKTRSHVAFRNSVSLDQAMAGKFVELGNQGTNHPINLLVWGDSHAMAITSVLDELCRQHSCRGVQATHHATVPVLGYVSRGEYSLNEGSPAFARAVIDFIAQKHVENVVISAKWNGYSPSDEIKTDLLVTVRSVLDTGARVFVLKDVPEQVSDLPALTALAALHHGELEQLGPTQAEYHEANREIAGAFDQISRMGATVLDPTVYFLNNQGRYGVVKNDQVLYWDSNHLTVEGAELLAPLFEPIFQGRYTVSAK